MKMINIIRANPLIIFHTPITVLSIKHLLIKFPTRKFTVLSTNIYLSNSPQEKLYYLILQMRKPRNHTAAAKSPQSCPTLCDPIDGSPPGSPIRDSLGKNTGVGCHFLLQCMKVKSESEVAH